MSAMQKTTNSGGAKQRPPLIMDKLCAAHGAALVDPSNRTHVLRQLEAEGEKRVESFPFDRFFLNVLQADFGQGATTTGWWRLIGNGNRTPVSFRLVVAGSPWNSVDQAVAAMCRSAGEQVVVARWEPTDRAFRATLGLANEQPEQPLDSVLHAALGAKTGSYLKKPCIGAGSVRARAAIAAMGKAFSSAELEGLCLSRLLVNCWLAPWANRQPMDIDAVCMLGGRLVFFEFKRKYPTAAGLLSLDIRPHMQFVDWLDRQGSQLHNVVLCDPAWDKENSPLYLLGGATGAETDARWLAKIVTPGSRNQTVSTQGADSGMSAGHREQAAFPVGTYVLLSRGMIAPPVRAFVEKPADYANATLEDLKVARQAARRKLGL